MDACTLIRSEIAKLTQALAILEGGEGNGTPVATASRKVVAPVTTKVVPGRKPGAPPVSTGGERIPRGQFKMMVLDVLKKARKPLKPAEIASALDKSYPQVFQTLKNNPDMFMATPTGWTIRKAKPAAAPAAEESDADSDQEFEETPAEEQQEEVTDNADEELPEDTE